MECKSGDTSVTLFGISSFLNVLEPQKQKRMAGPWETLSRAGGRTRVEPAICQTVDATLLNAGGSEGFRDTERRALAPAIFSTLRGPISSAFRPPLSTEIAALKFKSPCSDWFILQTTCSSDPTTSSPPKNKISGEREH